MIIIKRKRWIDAIRNRIPHRLAQILYKNDRDWIAAQTEKKLVKVFTPASPVEDQKYLYGRNDLAEQINRAINGKGAHILVTGERGVGKTSLIQVLAAQPNKENYYGAEEQTTFEDVCGTILSFRKVNQVTTRSKKTTKFTGRVTGGIDGIVGEVAGKHGHGVVQKPIARPALTPQEVSQRLMGHEFVFIIDEYDQIQDPDTKKRFAKLVRNLSDNSKPITLIFISASDKIDELQTGHPAITRCLFEIQVPRLTDQKLRTIAKKGFAMLGFQYEAEAINSIVKHSVNFTQHVHLLCESAVYAYLKEYRAELRDDWKIRASDVPNAIELALQNMPRVLGHSYNRAIRRSCLPYVLATVLYEPVTSGDIQHRMQRVSDMPKNKVNAELQKLAGKDLQLLERVKKGHYRFREHKMRALTILRFRNETAPEELARIDAILNELNQSASSSTSGKGSDKEGGNSITAPTQPLPRRTVPPL